MWGVEIKGSPPQRGKIWGLYQNSSAPISYLFIKIRLRICKQESLKSGLTAKPVILVLFRWFVELHEKQNDE